MLQIPIVSEFDAKGFKKAYKEFDQLKSGADKMSFAMKAAFAGAAAAAAAIGTAAYQAGKKLLEFANMAAEDQKSQFQLARSIKASTKATDEQIKGVEEWIDRAQRLTGVADDKLRPAFARIVRSTKSVTESTRLMRIALDVSAATGKDLETVANALAKAHDGTNRALMLLGVGFSKAELKAMPFEKVMGKLESRFSGAALDNAQTYAGTMERFKIATDELKESLGYVLLPALKRMAEFGTAIATAFGKDGAAGAIAEFKFQLSKLLYDDNGKLNKAGQTLNDIASKWNTIAKIGGFLGQNTPLGIGNKLSGLVGGPSIGTPTVGTIAPSVNPSQFREIRGATSAGVNVYITAGLGDPVAIGRQVYNTLQRLERRGGGRP